MAATGAEEFDPLDRDGSAMADVAIKTRLENIISSYKDARDVIAEPIQNAMDAIVMADDDDLYGEEERGQLTVTIDIDEDKIEISDNGCGFPREELKKFIAPEGTNKRDLFTSGKVRGHKGVGLTFLAYGFNKFQVEAKAPGEEPYRLSLNGGRDWVDGEDMDASSRPRAQISTLEEDLDRGTTVTIWTDEASNPSNLSYTFNTGKMTATILETQTALGVVGDPQDHPEVGGELVYISDSEKDSFDIDDSYRYPHQKLNEDLGDGEPKLETINIDEYDRKEDDEDATNGVLPKDQNRYHGVYRFFDADNIAGRIRDGEDAHRGEELQEQQQIRDFIREHELVTYVLYTYSNEYRNKLKKRWDIKGNRKFHQPGLRISTDGMISSWYEPVNLSYSGPRDDRLWFVYQMKNVRPDTGRKDFPQEVHDVIEVTKQFLHKAVVTDGNTFLRPTPPRSDPSGRKQTPLEKALNKDDISVSDTRNFGSIASVKEPGEEQDVLAIFNQLAGMNALNCYELNYFSSVDNFDGFLRYDADKVPSSLNDVLPGTSNPSGNDTAITLEFKLNGVDIIEHVINTTRQWEDMDLLVCWKLGGQSGENDSVAATRSFGGDTITFREPTSPEERKYAGVTHVGSLSSKGDVLLHTMSLKHLIDKI